MGELANVTGTVGMFVRVPAFLRNRLGAAAAARSGGYARRGALHDLVLLCLESGLDTLSPMCGDERDGHRCLLARGHELELPEGEEGRHSSGGASWPVERPRSSVKRQPRKRRPRRRSK
jgi:hypothetical protein